MAIDIGSDVGEIERGSVPSALVTGAADPCAGSADGHKTGDPQVTSRDLE